MAEYSLNPQVEQDSITAHIRASYPHLSVIEEGLLDDDNESIKISADGSIETFIVLWYSDIKRSPKGRSFSGYKLDSHYASVDVIVVSSQGLKARRLINDINDKLIGFKVADGGRMHKGSSMWSDARKIIDDASRPSRWAATSRYDFGIASKKLP